MDTIQENSLFFFGPLVAAYWVALGGWLVITRRVPWVWPPRAELTTRHKWLDLLLVVVGVAGLATISAVHRNGLLLPEPEGWVGLLAWNLNILLIFSPVLLVPLLRCQSLNTVYLSKQHLGAKIAIGLVTGVAGVVAFYLLRGQPGELATWANRIIDSRLFAKYFVPVFFEGVALAFLLVRMKWAFGRWPAVLIPAVLFSLGHLPNSLNSGESIGAITVFLSLNTVLVASILVVMDESQDVIWLSIPHYLMDVAIRAF